MIRFLFIISFVISIYFINVGLLDTFHFSPLNGMFIWFGDSFILFSIFILLLDIKDLLNEND